jgi:two-component system, NtrC family, response regulator HydG
MAKDDDDIIILLDDEPEDISTALTPWTVMVVDDDPSVHDGTRYALSDYSFEGRPISIISAFSAAEAKTLLKAADDVAVILLDVVMETDNAGLKFAKYVREELCNRITRIILRTGQPGKAPERQVIVDYDLNDYKSKAQLTDSHLFSSLTVALRSYEQVVNISASHQALMMIIQISELISTDPSHKTFFTAALTHLGSLLKGGKESFALILPPNADGTSDPIIDTGIGSYAESSNQTLSTLPEKGLLERLLDIVASGKNVVGDEGCFFHFPCRQGGQVVLVFPKASTRPGHDAIAITAFCSKLSVAYDNVTLVGSLKEMTIKLEERAERKSSEVESLRQTMVALSDSLEKDQIANPEAFANIWTSNKKMQSVFRYMEVIANSREPVLILGETGVGKTEIARTLHNLSNRKGAFLSVNLAGMSDHEFADTIFGHKRGAFAGADRVKKGALVQAENGTLYLKGIGHLNIASQARLLNLLEEWKYCTLGSEISQNTNINLIISAKEGLEKKVQEERFLPNLYFRLSSHKLKIPPLRERIEDLPLLISCFVEQAATSMDRTAPKPAKELFTLLSLYEFPGNITELRAMVYNAIALHDTNQVLSLHSFREAIENEHSTEKKTSDHQIGTKIRIGGSFPTLDEVESMVIEEALKKSSGNQGAAAVLLGISRQALNRRINRRMSHLKPEAE